MDRDWSRHVPLVDEIASAIDASRSAVALCLIWFAFHVSCLVLSQGGWYKQMYKSHALAQFALLVFDDWADLTIGTELAMYCALFLVFPLQAYPLPERAHHFGWILIILAMRCSSFGSLRDIPWRRNLLAALFVFNSRAILFAKLTKKGSTGRMVAMVFTGVFRLVALPATHVWVLLQPDVGTYTYLEHVAFAFANVWAITIAGFEAPHILGCSKEPVASKLGSKGEGTDSDPTRETTKKMS